MDILFDLLRSMSFSFISNKATTTRFLWTGVELLFYVISATSGYSLRDECGEGIGDGDEGVGLVRYSRDEDLMKVVRMGQSEEIGHLGGRIYRTGRPLVCEF